MQKEKVFDALNQLMNLCLSLSGLLNLNNYHADLPADQKSQLVKTMEKWVMSCTDNDKPSSTLKPLIEMIVAQLQSKGIDNLIRDEFWSIIDGFDGDELKSVQEIFSPIVKILANEYCPIDFDKKKFSLVKLEVPNFLSAIIIMYLQEAIFSFLRMNLMIEARGFAYGTEYAKSSVYACEGLAIGYLEVELYKMKYCADNLLISKSDQKKMINVYLNLFKEIKQNASIIFEGSVEYAKTPVLKRYLDPGDFAMREYCIDKLEEYFDELLRSPSCDDAAILKEIDEINEVMLIHGK